MKWYEERNGTKALIALEELITDTMESTSRVLRSLAVAHTDLLEHHGSLFKALRTILDKDCRVELAFLDPMSHATTARGELERGHIPTKARIQSSISLACQLRKEFAQRVIVRRYSDPPSHFLLFHCGKATVDPTAERGPVLRAAEPDSGLGLLAHHPYFPSKSGSSMPLVLCNSNDDLYSAGVDFFERVWDSKWLLCDFGNVLWPFKHKRFSEELVTNLELPADYVRKIDELVFGNPKRKKAGLALNDQLDTGKLDLSELRETLHQLTEKTIAPELFEQCWCSIFDPLPNSKVVEFLKDIQRHGIRIALTSSTNPSHWQWIKQRVLQQIDSLESLFDACFLTFDIGFCKDSPKFFNSICERTRRPKSDHWLLDDKQDYCDTANNSGVRSFLYTGPDSLDKLKDEMICAAWYDTTED